MLESISLMTQLYKLYELYKFYGTQNPLDRIRASISVFGNCMPLKQKYFYHVKVSFTETFI